MNSRNDSGSRSPRTIRRLTVVALLLTLAALLLCLVFVFHTTGGTLFLFSTLAPVLVGASVAIIGGVTVFEYLQSHRLFVIERFPAGHVIFNEGEDGDCAYFIRQGSVEVVDERGAVLATLGPGEYFGEMALITNSPRNATIRTVSPVELAALGKRNFLHAMKLLPATEQAILSTFRERAMRREEPGGP